MQQKNKRVFYALADSTFTRELRCLCSVCNSTREYGQSHMYSMYEDSQADDIKLI